VSLFTTGVMTILAFVFVAVSSYIVGLVGTSNNPVSGMTISALLATAVLFLVLGYQGDSAILATLGVAAVVCVAATPSGDCSPAVKTGVLVGATPKYQQLGQMIGMLMPACVIAPVLTLLHSSYGIGGDGLKAPQATLFASLTQALFGDGVLPYRMVAIGAVIGGMVLLLDGGLKRAKAPFRVYLMPLAVGIYLPITLGVPIFLGGLVRCFVERGRKEKTESSDSDAGVLVSSGFIAGESMMGILIALLIFLEVDLKTDFFLQMLSLAVLAGVAFYVFRIGRSEGTES